MKTLHNVWYPVALASDIDQDALFARKVLDTNVVFFRKGDGGLVALEDRCPHRFAPLSLGKKVGDSVACAYHGLQFGPDGVCNLNPHGDGRIPKAACVRSFPVCERHGIVWLWPGKAVADENRVPDLAFIQKAPATARCSGYLHSRSRYDINIDNLLDLTHADFLHPALLSTNGAILGVRPEVSEHPDGSVSYTMLMKGRSAIGFFAPFMPDPQANAENETRVTWWAPGIVHITSTAWQGDRSARSDWPAAEGLHLVVPETATTAHYSYIASRNFLVDDVVLTEQLRAATHHAFTVEDKPMLEAVQDRMGSSDLFELGPVLLSSDAGAVRVRRRMEQLINAEASLRPSDSEYEAARCDVVWNGLKPNRHPAVIVVGRSHAEGEKEFS